MKKKIKRFIYCLKRKAGGEIFYIGVTNDCKVRFKAHKLKFGNSIIMEIIEEVYCFEKSLEREKYWIKTHTQDGIILENKSGFELIPTKSVKITEEARLELKEYSAIHGLTMEKVASDAILQYIRAKTTPTDPEPAFKRWDATDNY